MERRKKGGFVPMPIVLNAWESDYCGDPLIAILTSLVDAIDSWTGEDRPSSANSFKEAAKDAAWYLLSLGDSIVSATTGLSPISAGEVAKNKKNERRAAAKVQTDFLEAFRLRRKALHQLQERLWETFGGKSLKVIVLVDELDRCRPDYAISYLETIKHVFAVKGLSFVLAVDYQQLAAAASALFGQHLKFPEYFRKFCHRDFFLPEPSLPGLTKLCGDYVKKYLEVDSIRSCTMPMVPHLHEAIRDLSKAWKLTPRQIQECFRVLGHVLSSQDPKLKGNNHWGVPPSAIILCFLRAANPELYEKVGRMEGITELCRVMVSALTSPAAEWFVNLLLTASIDNRREQGWLAKAKREAGYPVDEHTETKLLRDFSQAWGSRLMVFAPEESWIAQLCRMIEGAETF